MISNMEAILKNRCKRMRARTWGEIAKVDYNGFVNILTAQIFALELISIVRVIPQVKIFRLLWYNQENVCCPGWCGSVIRRLVCTPKSQVECGRQPVYVSLTLLSPSPSHTHSDWRRDLTCNPGTC